MNEKVPLYFRYNFVFDDTHKVVFEVSLHPETLEYIYPVGQEKPDWARLDYLHCAECTEHQQGLEYCPVAINIAKVVDLFSDVYSYDTVDIKVETNDRVYSKEHLSVQQGVSSILGIIMVSSNCKDMDKLRPMVRFHLPFATMYETIYRAVSMYLMAQYLRKEEGAEPDWDMQGLLKIYERIDHINKNLCQRLQIASKKDANLNAVVVLDGFSKMVGLTIKDTMSEFKHLFSAYLNE